MCPSVGKEDYSDIVIGTKKLSAISSWFDAVLSRSQCFNILVISGPTGCGKSSAVKNLALRKKVALVPFHDLLCTRKSVYPDLLTSESSQHLCKIYLLDDASSSLAEYHDFKTGSTEFSPPIIMIFTDSITEEPSLVSWIRRFLPEKRYAHIELPALSKTIMKRQLEKLGHIESCSDIINYSGGDLRTALNLFLLQSYIPDIPINLSLHCKDESIGLFHSLGKIIYSRKSGSVELSLSFIREDCGLMNLYLHGNCYYHIGKLSNTLKIADAFSVAGCLASSNHALSEFSSIPSRAMSIVANHFKDSSFASMKKPDILSTANPKGPKYKDTYYC